MGLPLTRSRTYVNGIPLIPDDVNEIEDAIIAGKFGPRWEWQGLAKDGPTGSAGVVGQYDAKASGGPGQIWQPLPAFATGTIIQGIGVRLIGTGGAQTVALELNRHNGNGEGDLTLIGQLNINNPPAAWATYTLILPAEEVVTDAKPYHWHLLMPAANTVASSVGWKVYKP
jgi:hypothetical protein